MTRNILHLDLDTFYVSCERLIDSRLQKQPIIVGGTGSRGVVSAASYEVRKYGVRSGMSMKMAKILCPEAIVIRGNTGTYLKYSQMVTDVIQQRVPLMEKASIDEFYADFTGMDTHFGCYTYASELRTLITKETGLPISFGLSQNKTVSKIATNEAKPNNQMQVVNGKEKQFLAPLSIRKIPMVGEKTFHTFCNLGVKKIETLQQMPLDMVCSVLGKHGKTIWEKAQGIDQSPVVPYHERKSISNERTFGRDTMDMKKLTSYLMAMAENLAYQLRRGNKRATTVSVKIRYADFQTYSKQTKITASAEDQVLISTVLGLFHALYQRRVLIRLIGVRCSGFVSGNTVFHLFDNNYKTMNLYRAVDSMREKYGQHIISKAATMGNTNLASFNPFDGEPPVVLAHRHV